MGVYPTTWLGLKVSKDQWSEEDLLKHFPDDLSVKPWDDYHFVAIVKFDGFHFDIGNKISTYAKELKKEYDDKIEILGDCEMYIAEEVFTSFDMKKSLNVSDVPTSWLELLTMKRDKHEDSDDDEDTQQNWSLFYNALPVALLCATLYMVIF